MRSAIPAPFSETTAICATVDVVMMRVVCVSCLLCAMLHHRCVVGSASAGRCRTRAETNDQEQRKKSFLLYKSKANKKNEVPRSSPTSLGRKSCIISLIYLVLMFGSVTNTAQQQQQLDAYIHSLRSLICCHDS